MIQSHGPQTKSNGGALSRRGAGVLTGAMSEVLKNANDLLPPATRKIVGPLLLYKICFFFFMACLIELVPSFELELDTQPARWPADGEPRWHSFLMAGDAASYLHIARNGYAEGNRACAFYPLWPFLIRGGTFLFGGSPFWTGLILANILSILALLLLHRFVLEMQGPEIAAASLVLLLAFPGAIFLSLIYTEPLFLLLSVTFLLLMSHGRYCLAGIAGFFLPLTKAVGILVCGLLAWELWRRRRPIKEYAYLAMPCLGYGCYLLTMWSHTGNPFEGFEAQGQFLGQPSIAKIFDVPGFLKAFASVKALHNIPGSLIDRMFFLLLVLLLPAIYRLNRALGLYVTIIGFISAMSAWFISYSRHLVMCFPVVIVLAKFLDCRNDRLAFWCTVGLLGALQICFLIRYLSFGWAG